MSLFIYVAVMKAALGDKGLVKKEIELFPKGGKACRYRAYKGGMGRRIHLPLNTSESKFCNKGSVRWLSG